MLRSLGCVLIFQIALAAAANGQVDKSIGEQHLICPGGIVTLDECLREHGIPPTKDNLLSALHSDDISLRNVAASELSAEGIKEAIPALLELFEAENSPKEKILLAAALAQLGDERGLRALETYCGDRTLPLDDRLGAAGSLGGHRSESCTETLMEGLQNDQFRSLAISMIPRFKELSPSETAQVRTVLVISLSDADSGRRLQAAGTLVELGDLSAVPALEAAAAKESDPVVRSAMEYYLKALQAKSRSGGSQLPN